MRQRSGQRVGPIVFTQFHPSNKSFKRGIGGEVKAKPGRGEML